MISIYSHIIDEHQVIGIGPLMAKPSNSEVERTLYRGESYWFDLYLVHYKVEISTNMLRFDPDHEKASNEEFQRFKTLHKELCSDLKNEIPLNLNFGI